MRNPVESSALKSTGKVTPCCNKVGLKRGPWTPEEDELLSACIKNEGEGRWRTLPKRAGLLRCGKSCRLRWMNYLRPCVKRGQITLDEEDLILRLHRLLGNRWSLIAGRIPGRTDNEIKNYWNTHLSKKLISQGIDPRTHKQLNPSSSTVVGKASGCRVSSSDLVPVKFQKASIDGADFVEEDVDGGAQVRSDLKYGCLNGEQLQGLEGSYMEEDISIYGDDDVFSLFLNSLINEDLPECSSNRQREMMDPVFMISDYVNQHKQPMCDADVYQKSFGYETNWESLISPDDHQAVPVGSVYGCVKGIQSGTGD